MRLRYLITVLFLMNACITAVSQPATITSNSSKPNFNTIKKEFYDHYKGSKEVHEIDGNDKPEDGAY